MTSHFNNYDVTQGHPAHRGDGREDRDDGADEEKGHRDERNVPDVLRQEDNRPQEQRGRRRNIQKFV